MIVLHRKTLEAALVQVPMPHRRVCLLPPLRVRQRQPAHELRELALLAWEEHQVPVIGHDAPVEDADRRALVRFDEHLLEGEEIIIFLEQTQAAVGAVQDVVDNSARGRSGRGVAWITSVTERQRQIKVCVTFISSLYFVRPVAASTGNLMAAFGATIVASAQIVSAGPTRTARLLCARFTSKRS